MNGPLPLVSVVIVNYNGQRFLEDCFNSLFALNYPADKLEVIMVDNGSTDDSLSFTKEKYPAVILLKNDTNNYCRANNLGISKARGSFTALINNDVMVEKDWLIRLVECIRGNKEIGAVGSKILFMDGSIQSVGHQEYPDFYWGDIGFRDKDSEKYGITKEVTSICGCSVLYRKECLKDVGFLDEDFNMFMEDVDMGIRCRMKKWRLLICPESIMHHKFHSTIKNEDNARYWIELNRLLLIAKHWPKKLPGALSGKNYFTAASGYSKDKEISSVLAKLLVKLIKEHGLEFTNNLSVDLFKAVRKIYNFEKDYLLQQANKQIQQLASLKEDFTELRRQKDLEINSSKLLLQQTRKELDDIYTSTAYKFIIKPLWGFLWPIKNNCKMAIRFIRLLPKPVNLHFRFTSRCNLTCRHCDIWKDTAKRSSDKELSVKEWKEAIDKLYNWLGKFKLDLAGGEILLYEGAADLIEYCSLLGIQVNLTTNASLITAELAKRIVNSGLNTINISLDGLGRVHEYTRDKFGLYSTVSEAVVNLAGQRRLKTPYITLATVITKYNLEELQEIVKLVDIWGLDGLIFQALDNNFGSAYHKQWYKANEFWPNDYDKVEAAINNLISSKKSGARIFNSSQQLNRLKEYYKEPDAITGYKCSSGDKNLIIDEYGGVRLCWNMEPVGNILAQCPREIWNSKLAYQKRKEIHACPRTCKILNCNYRE